MNRTTLRNAAIHLMATGSLAAQNAELEAFELANDGKMLLKENFAKQMPTVHKDLGEFKVLQGKLPSGLDKVNKQALVAYLNSDKEIPASLRLSAILKLRMGTERIYGDSDVFDPSDPAVLNSLKNNGSLPKPSPSSPSFASRLNDLSRSVGLIVRTDSISNGFNGPSLLAAGYGFSNNLCVGTPDFDKPCVQNSGTGFLTSDAQVVTAGHCVDMLGKDLSIIFGYSDELPVEHANDGIVITVRLKEPDVVIRKLTFLDKPIAGDYAKKGDWALFKIEDKVPDSLHPLELNEEDSMPPDGQNLVMLGHPAGLPLRAATKGRILFRDKTHFMTNLDAFIGNSGSPVFNGATWKIEGILTNGGSDFTKVNAAGCSEWVVVAEEPDAVAKGLEGEKVGRILPVVAAKKNH